MRILTLLLLIATPALAAPQSPPVEINPDVAILEFHGAFLGQPPDDDMICVKGACLPTEAEASKDPEKPVRLGTQLIASYKKPVDITHFAGVEVLSPRYDFFEGQLFQILFTPLNKPGETDRAMERILTGFDELYRIARIDKRQTETTLEGPPSKIYRTESGAIIEAHWGAYDDEHSRNPLIKIYDPSLMDTLRLTFNPNYVPKGLRRQ